MSTRRKARKVWMCSSIRSAYGMGADIHAAGNSTSSYEKVVRGFYTYWENFVTKRPFHSSDKWDLREVRPWLVPLESAVLCTVVCVLLPFFSKFIVFF